MWGVVARLLYSAKGFKVGACVSHTQSYAIKICYVPILLHVYMYVLSILFQEVVEEPAADGDSDHTDSGGSVVDSMEACEYSIA